MATLSERLRLAALAVLADSTATKSSRLSALQELQLPDLPFLRQFVEAENLDNELLLMGLKRLSVLEEQQTEIDRAAAEEKEFAIMHETAAKESAERQAKNARLKDEMDLLRSLYPTLDMLRIWLEAKREWTEAEKELVQEYERTKAIAKRDAETARLLLERFPEPRQLSPAETKAQREREEREKDERRALQISMAEARMKESGITYTRPGAVMADGKRYNEWGDEIIEEW